MTITLNDIKTEQSRLAEMIAAFEAQGAMSTITIPEMQIELKEGEHYAGIVLGKIGESNFHLILLPGEAESVNWADAQAWAEKAGGWLPTRSEQALLFANLREQFKSAWYWSGEEYVSAPEYAWVQSFSYGVQSYGHKDGSELRARAVRRLIIQ